MTIIIIIIIIIIINISRFLPLRSVVLDAEDSNDISAFVPFSLDLGMLSYDTEKSVVEEGLLPFYPYASSISDSSLKDDVFNYVNLL
jgi:hypothetical protein